MTSEEEKKSFECPCCGRHPLSGMCIQCDKYNSAQKAKHEAEKRAIFEKIENLSHIDVHIKNGVIWFDCAEWQALKKKFGVEPPCLSSA